MKKDNTTVTDLFVGMDTHKDSIQIVTAEAGALGEVRVYGQIAGDLGALDKVVRKLDTPKHRLRFVYEAGPRLCDLSSSDQTRVRLRGGGSVDDPQAKWRSSENRSS